MKGKKIINIAAALLICAGGMLLVFSAGEAAAGAAQAVSICLGVIIPSLFAFTVISKLFISTGVYRLTAKPFSPISRYIFRLPEEYFPVLIISQLAGYPIGAALINELLRNKRISPKESGELLCFCIAPGPAFIYAVTATAIPECPDAWKAVFIAVCGTNLLGALVTAPLRHIPPKKSAEIDLTFTAEIFTRSVKNGSETMLMICAMIVFTGAFLGVISETDFFAEIAGFLSRISGISTPSLIPVIRSFFEISNLSLIKGDPLTLLPITAAMLSFGGICVHLQICSACGEVPFAKALISRLPCAVISFFICQKMIPLFYKVTAVAVNANIPGISIGISNGGRHSSPILSVFLLIMTILLISQKNVAKKEKM